MILEVRERPDRARMMTPPGALRPAESWDLDMDDGEGLTVILGYESIELLGIPDHRWHLSVAGSTRLPRWDEVVEVAHRFRPGVMFCIPLPPRQFWLNDHELCLHVWEINDEPLADSWRGNPRVSPPT